MRISDWSSDVCSSDLRFVPDIQEVVMPEPIHGSCLCGQICFVVEGKFGPAGQCHCSKCRKVSGTDGNAVFYTARNGFRWIKGEDNIGTYEVPGQNGWRSSFCRTCGDRKSTRLNSSH